ncbi:hypothetical protein Tco_1457303 [Tanacetum coccineum]
MYATSKIIMISKHHVNGIKQFDENQKILGEAAYILEIKIYRDRPALIDLIKKGWPFTSIRYERIQYAKPKKVGSYLYSVSAQGQMWRLLKNWRRHRLKSKSRQQLQCKQRTEYMAAIRAAMEPFGLGSLLEILE